MASQSAHFNLTKPATTDNYNISVFNSNTDIIDTQMYNNQQNAAKVMVGATSGAAGESGRVPAPSAGDNTKYLRGDGTWQTVSGGGGSSSLSGLTDVSISSPTNGQVLKYNSTTLKWENADESGGSGSYSTTTLFTGSSSTTSGELTLSDSIRNYDMLMFVIGWPTTSTEAQASFLIDANYFASTYIYNNGGTTIADPHMFCCTYSTSYLRIKCGSANNKILIYDSMDTAVYKILGVKYGGGGSSSHTYSTTEHEVGTWIDGSTLYEKTIYYAGSITSNELIDNSITTSNTDYFVCTELSYVVNNSYRGSGFQIEVNLVSNGVIIDKNNAPGFTMTDTYATIRYTKVSS